MSSDQSSSGIQHEICVSSDSRESLLSRDFSDSSGDLCGNFETPIHKGSSQKPSNLCRGSDRAESTLTSMSSMLTTHGTSERSSDLEEDVATQMRWTNDKHSSYLNCMEDMFVRNLYDREYCAVDLCGERASYIESHEPGCVDSKPVPYDYAKLWEREGWVPLSPKRLHSWELPAPHWLHILNAKVSHKDNNGKEQQTFVNMDSSYSADKAHEPIYFKEDIPEVPDVDILRSHCLQSLSRSCSSSTGFSSCSSGKHKSSRCNAQNCATSERSKQYNCQINRAFTDDMYDVGSDDIGYEPRHCSLSVVSLSCRKGVQKAEQNILKRKFTGRLTLAQLKNKDRRLGLAGDQLQKSIHGEVITSSRIRYTVPHHV